MKIIQLEILNLASLDRQGGEVINFEEGALGDSNIFSIVGPTGSGKSTLLDAICLALYGRAPRYPKKSGDRKQGFVIYGQAEDGENNRPAPTDSVNILTRGKKTGYSKLTFKANNGNVYRAEWHVRFKSKAYDKPETYLYLLTQENGLPKEETADWNDLSTIIGLDYEQFLRTVLIAQGTFANFLTAKEDERFLLLEKLIGCEDLYAKIVQKIKDQKEIAVKEYNEINANYSAYEKDLIADEELQALERRISELEEEEKKVKEEIGKIVKSLGWYTTEAQFLENIGKYETVLKQAQQNLETMKDEIASLKLHDTTLPAVSLYKEIRQSRINIQEYNKLLTTLNNQIEAKVEAVKKETSELDTLKAKADAALRKLEEQKPHINKARIIKGELDAANNAVIEKERSKKEAEEKLNKAKETVITNEKDIQKAEKSLEEAKAAYNKLKTVIEEEIKRKDEIANNATKALEEEMKKAEGLDATTLQEASGVASQKKNDMAEAIRIRQSIKKTTEDLNNHNQEIQQLTERNEAIEKEISGFNIESLKKDVETLQKSYTLMTSENWNQHRADLDEGKPCPLCGSTHHPYKRQETFVPIVTEMEKLIEEKQNTIDNQEKKSKKLSDEKSCNLGTIATKNQLVKTMNSELGELQDSWKNIQAKYPNWPEDIEKLQAMKSDIDEDAEKADQKLKDYSKLTDIINELRRKEEKARSAQQTYKEQSGKDLEEAKEKINKANTALQTEKGKTANLNAQVQEKSQAFTNAEKALTEAKAIVTAKTEALKAEIGDNDPDTFEQQLQKAKDEAEKAVNDQTKKIADLENDKKGLQGQAKATEDSLKAEDKKLAEKEPKLKAWIDNYNTVSDHQQELTIDDIIRLSESTDDWEDIRKKLKELSDAVTQVKTTYENENEAHKKHQEKKPADDKETLEARKTELEQKSNADLVECKAHKKRHDDAKKAMGEIGEEIQTKRHQKDEWEEIANAIGGDGKTLRKIAQCYTLRFLIAHANVEIRKFNSRYELQQVKNSLGIRVIDHDRADDVRDTTSLSGGETFIVSLGLALGLSSLSSRNISFENLFIDEGFGTLDHDTLETVINSLAMLQSSQGKKVGVISHTDTMSRITTQIRIIRNGSSGSSHIEIYP
jgi:exonuclease SbcC